MYYIGVGRRPALPFLELGKRADHFRESDFALRQHEAHQLGALLTT